MEALNVRCGGEPSEIRQALRRLEALGLVSRTHEATARLTLSGLAVGVAVARSGHTKSRVHVRPRSEPRVASLAKPSVSHARRARTAA